MSSPGMSSLRMDGSISTPPAELEMLMHAAAHVAQVASAVAVSYAGKDLMIDRKADGSPVTAADRAAERSARDWIAQRFPRDGIHGEEFGVERPEARRRWFIDPIDGTKSFVRGVPLWGTLIAVIEGGCVLAGAAVLSEGKDLICAAPGQGAWWNGVRCSASPVSRLEDALVLTTDDTFAETPEYRVSWQRVQRRAGISRSWGDCYGYFLVATGRAEAMVDGRLAEWDAACFVPIIQEAGGIVTGWDGSAAFSGNLVATNAGIARELRDLLHETTDKTSSANV